MDKLLDRRMIRIDDKTVRYGLDTYCEVSAFRSIEVAIDNGTERIWQYHIEWHRVSDDIRKCTRVTKEMEDRIYEFLLNF